MESGFQFTNPTLVGIEYEINDGFQSDDEEINIQINMTVSVERSKDTSEARVVLRLGLGEKDGNTPFFINASEAANFRWNQDVDENIVDTLLNQNAPSLLLSYLRPVITQITSASPFDAFNIPFMDFTNQKKS